jgi:molybdate transport system ATP-binding protein
MTLDAHLVKRLGSLDLDIRLTLADGDRVALLGPNGSGKSTVLRCLAGLVELDDGQIVAGGETFDCPLTGTFVEADRRQVGLVFQDYALFAHLDVVDNVAFGLRARGIPKRAARSAALELLAATGLAGIADQAPSTLSGGQAQRVALARALATSPRLLLLDEPLAALDAESKVGVRRDLHARLQQFSGISIVVTHDPVDAFALADHVIVLAAGRIVQQGTLAELAARPANRYVAELLGVNLLQGTVTEGQFVVTGGLGISCADHSLAAGPAVAVIRPQAVSLYAGEPGGSPRNAWHCRVREMDVQGGRVRVRLGGPLDLVAEVTTEAVSALDIRTGGDIWATVKATDVQLHPD